MIDSIFISDILNSIIEGEKESHLLRLQIIYLTTEKFNYTGTGVFVEFQKDTNIENYRIDKECVLNGLVIKSQELDIDAEAILFIRNGLIDCLEIWSRSGSYPYYELRNYELIQTWK